MRWARDKEFRKTGDGRVDCLWVRHKARSIDADGKLDGRTVGKLHGLFRIWDGMHSVHEVALVRLLRVKGSRRPHSEEGMIRMELMGRERGFILLELRI